MSGSVILLIYCYRSLGELFAAANCFPNARFDFSLYIFYCIPGFLPLRFSLRVLQLCHLCVLGSWVWDWVWVWVRNAWLHRSSPSGVVHVFTLFLEWLPCCPLNVVRCPLSVAVSAALGPLPFPCSGGQSIEYFMQFARTGPEHNAWELAQLFRPPSVNKIFTASERYYKRNYIKKPKLWHLYWFSFDILSRINFRFWF